jgi:hypothetical protein
MPRLVKSDIPLLRTQMKRVFRSYHVAEFPGGVTLQNTSYGSSLSVAALENHKPLPTSKDINLDKSMYRQIVAFSFKL